MNATYHVYEQLLSQLMFRSEANDKDVCREKSQVLPLGTTLKSSVLDSIDG